MAQSTSIYIHYPFCKAKCPYCDFNSHVANIDDEERWSAAYLSELEYFHSLTGTREIKSIFFGGGTPSLMPISMIDKIINNITKYYNLGSNIEISLEANPTSSELQKFKNFKDVGINRLSIGIQALNDHDLKFLGREHSQQEAINTIKMAAKYFDNFSFDLIYARPQQKLQNWKNELKQALEYNTPHLSLYQLTIEKGTKFYKDFNEQKFSLPNDNQQADLYEATNEICYKYGLNKYEISNYAKPEYHSVHNLNYWQYGDYIAIGAGAHSRLTFNNEKHSFMTHHLPNKWLEQVEKNGHAIQSNNTLNETEMLEELLMFGLRTSFGIELKLFTQYFAKSYDEILSSKLQDLIKEGLLQINHDKLQISTKGEKVLNSVIKYLIKA